MKDKITVATYMRVGNKEQLDTTGQEHKIPTPEELIAEGYDVITLPKKKAWLFMRSSVGMPDSERDTRMGILEAQAKAYGYDVAGKTVVIGKSDKATTAIKSLLNNEFKREGVDVLFMRGIRDMSFRLAESFELYDKIRAEGYDVKSADGSDEAFNGETEHGRKWRKIFEQIIAGQREEETEQTEPSEEQDEGEAPTMTMGGGMQ